MSNQNRVYLLGAGVNQSINFQNNNREIYHPPMSRNFFRIALCMDDYISHYYDSECDDVREYIYKYWKMERTDLIADGLDLEELFTLLQLQRMDADKTGNLEKSEELNQVASKLFNLLISVLKNFKWANFSSSFLKFGKVIYKEKPTVITFNYDDFIERAIEHASGRRDNDIDTSMMFPNQGSSNRSQVITNSEWNWNRPLAYGIKFDDVMLYDNASGPSREKFFDGHEFYSHNKVYGWNILKLHGSLNWWRFTKFSPNTYFLSAEEIARRYDLNRNKISLQERDIMPGSTTFTLKEQLYVEPTIITPELHKDYFYQEQHVYDKVFRILWAKAREVLSGCESLVIIGYSFPPTDFYTKKLFLESFSDANKLKEIIVVNPDDRLPELAGQLCHYEKIKHFKYLEEFVDSCSQSGSV